MVIKMLNELRGRTVEHNENINRETVSIKKDIETIKKNQTEMRNLITESKNTLEGFNSRFNKRSNQ